jgi:hypothetical protein
MSTWSVTLIVKKNLRGREDLLIHGQKILMDYSILPME